MPLIRKSAADAPAHAATPAGVIAGLAGADEEMRWAAAREAAGSAQFARPLAAALQAEAVPRVREAMLTSLARIGNAESMAGILPLLRSDDASLRTAALDALRVMIRGAPDLLPPLLRDPDVDVRILSCELTRALDAAGANAQLCELLRHEADPNACAAAIDVLAEVGLPDALPVLASCAARFSGIPFITFAAKAAADRISAGRPRVRD